MLTGLDSPENIYKQDNEIENKSIFSWRIMTYNPVHWDPALEFQHKGRWKIHSNTATMNALHVKIFFQGKKR